MKIKWALHKIRNRINRLNREKKRKANVHTANNEYGRPILRIESHR